MIGGLIKISHHKDICDRFRLHSWVNLSFPLFLFLCLSLLLRKLALIMDSVECDLLEVICFLH